MEFINMTCRNCGGKLQFTKDAEQILCQHCGTEFQVFLGENSVSLKKLEIGIQAINSQAEKTNAELALKRLRDEEDDIWKKAWSLYQVIEVGHHHSDLPNHEQKAPYTTNPRILFMHLKREFEDESKKMFKNKHYLAELTSAIESCNMLVQRLDQIENEKKEMLKVVKPI